MKTIQEYFRKLDNNDKIIKHYISKNPLTIKNNKHDFNTVKAFESLYNNIDRFVEKIKNTEIKELDKKMILIAHHNVDLLNNEDDIFVSLFNLHDIKNYNSEIPQTYAFEFTPLEEAVGFYVADTYLTQYSINDVLVEFLEEMTFFGFDEAEKTKERENLDKVIEEVEKNRDKPNYFKSFEDVITEMSEKYDFKLEERDKEEHAAYRKLSKQVMEYNKKAIAIEIEKCKEVLND